MLNERNSVLLLLLCISGLLSSAQVTEPGEISGHIYDAGTHEQLIGATVVLLPGSKKMVSSLEGKFSFKGLKAGDYTISVTSQGYGRVDTSLFLPAGGNLKFDMYLRTDVAALSTVIVAAKAGGESDEFARRKEQFSNNIVNIVSANTIAISPDITVANVIQRISGVSVERGNSGDGQYAIIRGMDKRYNTTLINGVKIPSPDNKNRFVPLDIFPAEMMDRIEVIKSLTPEMEGDATGGVMNLVMKNAPDKFRLEGNAGTGYSQIFFDRDLTKYSSSGIPGKSPAEVRGPGVFAPVSDFSYRNFMTSNGKPPLNSNFGLTAGDRFLGNKLGVIVSASYQNVYRGNNSNVMVQSPTVAPAPSADGPWNQTFSDVEVRQYSSRQQRLGLETKIDYEYHKHHTLSLFAAFVELNEYRVRHTIDTLLGGYSMNGYIGGFAIKDQIQTRTDLQNIFNTTLQGRDQWTGKFSSDWSLVYSRAKRQLPDIAQFSTGRSITPDQNAGTDSIGDPTVDNSSREWMHNTDQDMAAYLNFHEYLLTIGSHRVDLSFGGMFRHKERDNYDNKYSLSPLTDAGSNYEQFISIPASKFTFIPANAALGNANGNAGIYHFSENVGAGYGQLRYTFSKKWEAIGGLRVEHTGQDYTSSLPASVYGKSATISYIDFLPSIQAKYSFDEKKALRVAYFKSICRPAYADLILFEDNSTNESYTTTGDPALQHTRIDNFDLRYEIFPKGLDELMIGAFYKSIKNPIEYALTKSSNTEQELKPGNFGNAENFGAELTFRKFFGNFGLSGNYTYTHSSITSGKIKYYHDAAGNTHYDSVGEKRPLQGQSAHVGNLSLLYKNPRIGVDAQLALVYTGERINTLSLNYGLDNWETATTFLDFSGQKQFGRHYIVYVKVNNILNTPYKVIIKQANYGYQGDNKLPFQQSAGYVTAEYDRYYANYTIGVRFKF